MMEEYDDKDDTKRKSRNLSEKKRRDQFNLLVNELCTMVSANSRKMDKSTVLKSTIAFLKNHNEVAVKSRVHEIQENWKPSFLPNEEFTHLILEALDGYLIVFSTSGTIQYVSESITPLLEHLPNDLINMTIYDIVHEDEHQNIYNILMNPSKILIDPLQSGISSECQVTFTCHVKRGSADSTSNVTYDMVKFTGYFRENVDVENIVPSSKVSNYSIDNNNEKKTLFVGTGRLTSPQLIREVSLLDTKSEFTSRHSLEWKFLFLDHRAPPIIGYLPFEVLGTSGYDYYHFDDLERIVSCHEALMQKGEGTSCYYRFLTKGQQWIWLQTRFYITYHQWNSKPEFVVCTHRVVSFADVLRNSRRKNDSSLLGDNDENDDKTNQASTSSLNDSQWSKGTRRSQHKFKSSRHSYRPEFESTSMSADSPISHQSAHTQQTSITQRSRTTTKHYSQIKPSSTSNKEHSHQAQAQMFTQYSMPQTQTSQTITFQQQNSQPLQPSPHTMLSSNSSICHQSTTSEHSQSTPMSTPFMDQSYIAAIPVQPMFAGTVIAPVIPPPADYVHSNVVLSPAQNHFQDHLQRRHEELQKIIMQQQDELRRVSEQLLFTKYGIIPVNVQVPFVTTIDSTEQNQELSSESSPCMSSSSHMMHSNYYEQNPPQNVQMVVPPYQQQQMMSGHHHDPIMSQHTTQLQQNYGELKPIESSDGSDYLQSSNQQQQQSQQQQQQHQQQQQQQQQQQSNDYEMMSYQMMTGQWESNTSQQSQQQNQQENATDSMNN